ncbi:MAG: hypothetical protein HPZ00_06045 [Christensenellaceae bacterium]|nr:hypothetical protein [Christensenellaceae bacterium]MBS6565296.1 hypothetical protein [Clostridiales bacterium]PWM00976.1 MAG: hypothetical protein DBY09_01510 [Selenomonadales bacterium]
MTYITDLQSHMQQMSEENRDKYNIELPQSIIESFARFLVREMKNYYAEQQEKSKALQTDNKKQQKPRVEA